MIKSTLLADAETAEYGGGGGKAFTLFAEGESVSRIEVRVGEKDNKFVQGGSGFEFEAV